MNKAFLFLCTLLAIFISLSGLTTLSRLQDSLPHIIFLPVTLYLVLASAKQLTKTHIAPEVNLTEKKYELILITLIFLALLGLGYRSITQARKSPSPSTQPIVLSESNPTPTPPPAPSPTPGPSLEVIPPDANTPVNVRSQPSTKSELIDRLPGGTFPILSTQNNWYQIQLTSTSSAWISGQYVKVNNLQP